MEINVKELEKSEVELSVTIDAKTVDKEMVKAFERLRSQLKISGFRPGKVPADIARKHVPESEVRANFLETCLPRWYLEAVREKDLKIISDPKFDIDKFDEGKNFSFKARVAVYPQITLGDYQKVRVKPKEVKIADKEVSETLELLRKQRSRYEPAQKKAAKENVVVMNVQATMNGEELKAFTRDNYQHYIGENFLAPGFDEEVTGLGAGDIKKFDILMPADYPIERYRKQKIHFVVTVKEVKAQVLPPLDDTFAKNLGAKDFAALKTGIKSELEMSHLREHQTEFAKAVLEKVAAQAKVVVPDVLIEDETERLRRELEWRLSQQGFTLGNFLKAQKKKMEDVEQEWKTQAEQVAKLNLVLDAIANEEGIEVKDAELEGEMGMWLSSYRDQGGRLNAEGKKMQQKLESVNGRIYLTQLLRREKTKRHLYEIANPPEEKKAEKKKKDKKEKATKK